MNIALQFELQDDQERQAFMRFAEMIEKYRMAKWNATQPAPAAPEPAPAAETPPPAEEPPAPPVESEHAPTLAEIQQRFKDYAVTPTIGFKKARDLLTEFGINRVPELPKERYAEFMGRLNQIVVSA